MYKKFIIFVCCQYTETAKRRGKKRKKEKKRGKKRKKRKGRKGRKEGNSATVAMRDVLSRHLARSATALQYTPKAYTNYLFGRLFAKICQIPQDLRRFSGIQFHPFHPTLIKTCVKPNKAEKMQRAGMRKRKQDKPSPATTKRRQAG